MSNKPFDRHPRNVPGDFYVQNGYCQSCGVPESIAPDLIGRSEDQIWHCFWKKQPETQEEWTRAIQILHAQELDGHRYAGIDQAILEKLLKPCCDLSAAPSESSKLDFSKGRAMRLLPQQEESGWLAKLLGKIVGR